MSKRITIIIVILAILFFDEVLPQQQVYTDSIYVLDSVVVSSTRNPDELLNLPYSIDYLNQTEIQPGEAGLSLEEISYGIPGLTINNRRNYALGDKITIRGIGARSSFGVRGIKIIYDGIPMTLPDGQTQLNNIDLTSAGKIEILKGPASSLYGNSAGGVINIVTEVPSTVGFAFSPQVIFGSYGLQKYSAKASGSFNNNSFVINFNKFNYKGFREHSAASSVLINASYKTIISDKTFLQGIINYFNTPYLLNPSSLSRDDANNSPTITRSIIKQSGVGEKISQLHTGLSLMFNDESFSFESTIFFGSRYLLNPIPGRIIELNRSTMGNRNVFSTKLFSSDVEVNLQAGVDIEFQFDDRKEFENRGLDNADIKPEEIFPNLKYGQQLLNQDENVFNTGPFFSSEFVIDNFRLTSALRYDYYRFKVNDNQFDDLTDDSGTLIMNHFSPMAGIVYRFSDAGKVFINYSTSFLTPTTSELSNQPDKEGGFNPNLMPEKITSYELGVQTFVNKFKIGGAVFYLHLNDMLIPYQVSGSEETFFRNAGSARNAGAEFSAEYFLSNELHLTTGYSYMNFIFQDYQITNEENLTQLAGNKIPGIPENKISFAAAYNNPDFYLKILFIWSDKYFTNDFNGPQITGNDDIKNYINDAYYELNLRTGYHFSFPFMQLEIYGAINNLLNRRYNSSIILNAMGNRFFEPAPSRNWYAGIKVASRIF